MPEVNIVRGHLVAHRLGLDHKVEIPLPVAGRFLVGLALVDLLHVRLDPLIGAE